jgi:Protein of unknown function (DUF4231)
VRSATLEPEEPVAEPKNPTLDRLEDQLKWYDGKSGWNQKMFKGLKVVEIIAAALIPFAAGLSAAGINISPYIAGSLGVVVVVLEGLQSLYQFQNLWTSYRSTAEGLKHEKYLWLAGAGPYLNADNPPALFADRVEALISTEHAKWVTEQQQVGKEKSPKS